MSAHQMLFMRNSSQTYSPTFTSTGASHSYYSGGCGTSIDGYVSGSQGSISPATFNGANITVFAVYGNSNAQNDSQNQDPQEWYCTVPEFETVLTITGITSQSAFSKIRFFNGTTFLSEITSASATFGSGTWTWAGQALEMSATSFVIDY